MPACMTKMGTHFWYYFALSRVYKHARETAFSLFCFSSLARKHINYAHARACPSAAAPFRAMWKTSAPDASSDSLLCALFSRRAGTFPALDSIAQAPDATLCHSLHTHTHTPAHTDQTPLQKIRIMAADTYMSICIQCGLSLETKTTMQGGKMQKTWWALMRDEIVPFIYQHLAFCSRVLSSFLSFSSARLWFVLCAPAWEYSQSSLYQCHGGCQANERGLSLEQEGLGCAIHSAYLNAL